MRLALAVSALLLIASPLHAQKSASKKSSTRTKQDTALVAKQAGTATKKTTKTATSKPATKAASSKDATTKTASKKEASTKDAPTKSTSKTASSKRSSTKAESAKPTTKPENAKPETKEAKQDAKQAGAKHDVAASDGQFVGSKQGHTYYLASCKAAKSLSGANKIGFSSEADAKKAGYAHSKQKGC